MGLLNIFANSVVTAGAGKGRIEPVVTLNSTVNIMPNPGKKLLARGYKLQSVTVDRWGNYSWIFVWPDYAA